ncbi:DUF3857 and transglutaminase domain-containing protein [Flavobacterium poyangense]|uniref:DUF3857 and transglutaminase domain-containing protein n=1 Tax=Flavobacterium poyangense TaxID=2204302 RepID=UPI0014200F3A|nr:DUF3857 and transglutaminase domain-containing protein [Flavobacterium sp. JXAS1]
MLLRVIGVLFFVICSSIEVCAQNYELGKVTIEELQEKAYPKDTSAIAAILSKKGRTFFTYNSESGFTTNHVYEFRIKIYKKEGLSWANQRVSYYVGYENLKDDKVAFSKAVTYNLENGAIVKTKLDSEGSFKNKINKFWNVATITLPNVKVGSVIEFKYTLKSENVSRLPDFDFQYEIPVNYFEYKTEIPEFFLYKTLLKGFIKPEMSSEFAQIRQVYANNYRQINSSYTAKDIPALKEEEFVDNIDNYKGSIQNELELKRFPDMPVVNYTKTWEGVAATIYKEDDFGKELSEKDFFSADLKNVLQGATDPKERLNAIFKFVQTRMNWNKMKGYYVDKGVKKAYEEKTGNVAEINFMLISMLRSANIEANPVLVSTIENGIPVFPNRTVFNYVIVAAEIGGQQILLDATNKFTSPDILPLNVLNWNGRLIKGDGSTKEVSLLPSVSSKNSYTLNVIITPDLQKLEGTLKIKKTDYNALNFRTTNAAKTNDSYLEKLENEFAGIEIKEYNVENKEEDLSSAVVEKINFVLNSPFDIIGGKIFMKPLLGFGYGKNPFNQENRQMPIHFNFKDQLNYSLSCQIPEGYDVESMPKSKRIMLEDKGIVYTLNIVRDENRMLIKSEMEINRTHFVTEEYDMLKEFFQNVIEFQNEKIVLKKA